MRARSTFLVALALFLTGYLSSCGSDTSSDGSTATESEQASDAPDAANVISVSVVGDKMMDPEPAVENKTSLTADIPGVFEVELEDSGTILFELEVS